MVIEHSRHGGQSQAIPKPSRLLPNVAVMPVLGISPCGILSDLLVYDFQGYPLGDLQGACDRCRFDPKTRRVFHQLSLNPHHREHARSRARRFDKVGLKR